VSVEAHNVPPSETHGRQVVDGCLDCAAWLSAEQAWRRLSPPTGNVYADRARARKVAAILARVPFATNALDREREAQVLERFTREDRDVFAAAAGQKPPSDETWRQVVAAVRARKTDDELWGCV
jgi:hypothetical protein